MLLSQRTPPSLRKPPRYAHETASLLDVHLNLPGTSWQVFEETYGNPYETDGPDPDTGAQVEICMSCSLQYP
jgi:hypothetical protein